jgi:hypothetical protein
MANRYLFEGSNRAIMEFNVGTVPVGYVFPGDSMNATDAYPGLVDGCVLVAGDWGFVITIDDELLSGDSIVLPSVLAMRSGLEVGEESVLFDASGRSVRIRREPHAALLMGGDAILRKQDASQGDRAVVLISRDSFAMSAVPAGEPGSSTDLLSRLGIVESNPSISPFSLIAAALGESQPTDRAKITAVLRARGRRDLAELAESLPLARRRVAREHATLVLDASMLCADDTRVEVVASNGERMLAIGRVTAAEGPLGLQWQIVRNDPSFTDLVWVRWVRAVIRAWAHAAAGPDVNLEFSAGRWCRGSRSWPSLVAALEAIPDSDVSKPFVLPPSDEPMLPETGLGCERMVRSAVMRGIAELRIDRSGWSTGWEDGRLLGPTSPLKALEGMDSL